MNYSFSVSYGKKPMSLLLILFVTIYLLSSLFLFPGATLSLTDNDKQAIYSGLEWLPETEAACDADGSLVSLVNPGKVYILGDSLTLRAKDDIEAKFSPPWSAMVNGSVGRPSRDAPEIITGYDKDIVASANAIVVALGTNDGGADISNNISSTMEAIRSVNSVSPVFWVDVASTQVHLNGVNKSIHDGASEHDYQVLSWFREVFDDADPTATHESLTDTHDYLDTGGYHQTAAGNIAFANLMFGGVSSATRLVSAAGVTGGDNREKAFNYFRLRGLSGEQSAGIVGNFMAETAGSMSPAIAQGDPSGGPYSPYEGSVGYGLAQWTSSDRKDRLEAFAEATGRPIDSLDMQLDFTWFEMTAEPAGTGVQGGTEKHAYNELLKTSTPEDAAVTFARKFERNSASEGEADGIYTYLEAHGHRIDYANSAYADFSGSAPYYSAAPGCEDFNLNLVSGDTTHIPCEGRIVNEYEAPGYQKGELHMIRVCVLALPNGESGPHVNSQISGAVAQLLIDSWSEGVNLEGGGFRTMEQQSALRQIEGRLCGDDVLPITEDEWRNAPASSCSPPTARPGYSNHQMGYAVDFKEIGMCPSAVDVNGQRFCQAPGNIFWDWLNENASRYGLQQLRTEAWHWSIDGG